MILIRHFMCIGTRIPAASMNVGRIQVEKCFRRIVALDNLQGRGVFDLHSLKPLRNFRKPFNGPKSAGHGAGHAGPGSQDTMCPATFAARLCQSGASLSRPDVEPPGTFKRRQLFRRATRFDQFFPREWSKANTTDKFILLIAQNGEEIHQFGIKIIVGFNPRGYTVDQDRGGPTVNIAEVFGVRGKVGQDEIKMYKFAPVPPEGNHLLAAPSGVTYQPACAALPLRRFRWRGVP